MAIKGKSRKRSKSRAPALPPKPAYSVRKTPIVLRRDVKRSVVIVLAVLAFLGGIRVWENVSRSDSLRAYDRKIAAAQSQFIQYFSPQAPASVDSNLQNFKQNKLAAATFLSQAQTWQKDFAAAATAIGKLKTPNKTVREAQFLIQAGISEYSRIAGLWTIAAQLKQAADQTADKTIKQKFIDREQSVLLQADDMRTQGSDPLYRRGATLLTNLNVEWGLQKKQSSTSNTSTSGQ